MKKDYNMWQGISLWIVIFAALLLICKDRSIELMSLSSDRPLWTRLTFHFVHANMVHFAINALALLTLSFKVRPESKEWIAAFVLSSTFPFVGEMSVCGLSAMIYAMLGIRTLYCKDKKNVLTMQLSVIIFGMLLPNIAVGIHLWSYGLGLLWGLLTVPLSKITQ